MEDNLMLVFTDPVTGMEAEFNDWYSNTHIPEIVKLTGMRGARRYRVGDGPRGGVLTNGYLAIYDLGDDPQEALRKLDVVANAGQLTPSDAVDRSGLSRGTFYSL